MLNLLPQQEQRYVARNYRLRLVAVGLLLLGWLGTIASAALVPSLFLSNEREVSTRNRVETLKNEILQESKENLSQTLKRDGQELLVLDVGVARPYAYGLVALVIQDKTPALAIYGFRVEQKDDGTHTVTVNGRSRDRNSLLSFVRTLQREKQFSKVTEPVSDFAASANINFSIVITAT